MAEQFSLMWNGKERVFYDATKMTELEKMLVEAMGKLLAAARRHCIVDCKWAGVCCRKDCCLYPYRDPCHRGKPLPQG